jgi:hypothetical protein
MCAEKCRSSRLVFNRFVHTVNDKYFDGAPGIFESEAELFLQRCEDGHAGKFCSRYKTTLTRASEALQSVVIKLEIFRPRERPVIGELLKINARIRGLVLSDILNRANFGDDLTDLDNRVKAGVQAGWSPDLAF